MIYVRGQPENYDHWAQLSNRGWSYDDVLPYFAKSERRIGPGDPRIHGSDGRIPVSDMYWHHPVSEAFIRSCANAGLPLNPDYNAGDQEGVGYFQRTIGKGFHVSSAVAYLKPAMRRGNVRLITNPRATRILMDEKRATGVRFVHERGGEAQDISATREFIICAGTVNTARLLQISGSARMRISRRSACLSAMNCAAWAVT